jgi:maleate isomerase
MLEYGQVLGLLVPQANTTVEPEMQRLLGSGHTLLSARMCSSSQDSRERLQIYGDLVLRSLGQFDVAPLQAVGFACTGSSYLWGYGADQAKSQEWAKRAGYPVLPATLAITQALQMLNIKRIGLFSPYPTWLAELGLAYWQEAGFIIHAKQHLPIELLDTRNIYHLRSEQVIDQLKAWDVSGCDAVLMSGTGMPTLRAITQAGVKIPVLSSNLCLAWALRCAVSPSESRLALWQQLINSLASGVSL